MSKRNQASPKTRSRSASIEIARSPVPGRRIAVARRFPKISVPLPSPSLSARLHAWLNQAIQRLAKSLHQRRTTRRNLQLLEIQQLGEKRFVAIVRVGKQKFLIGGAATSVSLLAEIHSRSASILAAHPPIDRESA
jgi:hypothetical protein